MVFDSYMTHNTALNPQFEDTIVTAILLIYYKDAIKKKTCHLSECVFFFLVHSLIFR